MLSLSLAAFTLCGCSPAAPMSEQMKGPVDSADNQITSLGLEPDLDYERPSLQAHIEINQLGYAADCNKIAVFRGDNLSATFNVIDADTKEVVYTGDIKEKLLPDASSSYFYGDFSEYTSPGVYYIQTDVIGYSYPFEIKEDIYDEVMTEALKQFYFNRCGTSLSRQYAGDDARNACHTENVALKSDGNVSLDVTGGWHINTVGDRSVEVGCNVIETLLLAYEYNTDACTRDFAIPESEDDIPDILNEIKTETDWLLKMQDQVSGAVYQAVSVVDKGQGADNPCHVESVNMDATLAFASALGYFSYIYQNYDTGYATTCLQAADRAMKYASKFPTELDEDGYFKAATMLYRATGYFRYKQIITDYCSARDSYDMANNKVFNGVVTYMATKQKTDAKVCDVMMKNLRAYAEKLASDRRDALYLMGAESSEVNHATLLSEIARLTVVNYILSSNEYKVVMERYLHYFLGCNPVNTCYIGQYGSINIADTDVSHDILRQPELDAYLILLVSGVHGKGQM